jgi:K(+)-stimulated pyrophosphate-energized sodium pump
MLGGYMAGVTVSGVLWAVFQNNAGERDNAKIFEAGVMINGEMTFKGSQMHIKLQTETGVLSGRSFQGRLI